MSDERKGYIYNPHSGPRINTDWGYWAKVGDRWCNFARQTRSPNLPTDHELQQTII